MVNFVFFSLGKCYRAISGVKFEEVDVDGEIADTKANVLNCVLKHFPTLRPE